MSENIQVSGNTIRLSGPVGEGFMESGITGAGIYNALEGLGDVIVKINSPGGDVWEGMSIYNALKAHEGKVTVIVSGLAASAASYIAMAADEVLINKNSLIMIHAPMTLAFGNADEMRATADNLDLHADAMAHAYVERSGKTKEEIDEIFSEEVWYNAESAVQEGFADRVIEEEGEEPSVSAKVHDMEKVAACVSQMEDTVEEEEEELGCQFCDKCNEPCSDNVCECEPPCSHRNSMIFHELRNRVNKGKFAV